MAPDQQLNQPTIQHDKESIEILSSRIQCLERELERAQPRRRRLVMRMPTGVTRKALQKVLEEVEDGQLAIPARDYAIAEMWASSPNHAMSIVAARFGFSDPYLVKVVLQRSYQRLLRVWKSHQTGCPTTPVCTGVHELEPMSRTTYLKCINCGGLFAPKETE